MSNVQRCTSERCHRMPLLPASEGKVPRQETNAPSGNTRSVDIKVTGERKPILQTNTPVYEDAKGVGEGIHDGESCLSSNQKKKKKGEVKFVRRGMRESNEHQIQFRRNARPREIAWPKRTRGACRGESLGISQPVIPAQAMICLAQLRHVVKEKRYRDGY